MKNCRSLYLNILQEKDWPYKKKHYFHTCKKENNKCLNGSKSNRKNRDLVNFLLLLKTQKAIEKKTIDKPIWYIHFLKAFFLFLLALFMTAILEMLSNKGLRGMGGLAIAILFVRLETRAVKRELGVVACPSRFSLLCISSSCVATFWIHCRRLFPYYLSAYYIECRRVRRSLRPTASFSSKHVCMPRTYFSKGRCS